MSGISSDRMMLLMQFDCDKGLTLEKGEVYGFKSFTVLLFENESQLQLEFHRKPVPVDVSLVGSWGIPIRKLLVWRACLDEKSGCSHQRAALFHLRHVPEATQPLESPCPSPLFCSRLLGPVLVGQSAQEGSD